MSRVVDTSVVVPWYVQEEGSPAALPLLGSDLIAPPLLKAELANALWKKVRRLEISNLQALAVQAEVEATVQFVDAPISMIRALEMAVELRHPVYDCVFLTLAEEAETTLVTADRRFVRACAKTQFERLVEFL